MRGRHFITIDGCRPRSYHRPTSGPDRRRFGMASLPRRSFFHLAAAGSATLVLARSTARGQSRDPIKIGFPIPLTGPYGAEASDQQAGATLAVDEVNSRGSLRGRRVELLVRGVQLKPDAGAQRTNELIESAETHFVIG